MLGVTYDAQDDLLDVALSGLNHLIRRPREIYVQEGAKGVETVAVVSADGMKQILHLKDPIMLPAAEHPGRCSRRLQGESWIGGTRDRSRNSAI